MKKSAKKYRNALIVMVILVFGSVSLALAEPAPFKPWQCLVYDGMVVHPLPSPGFPYLYEDTGVFVTNPNPVPVSAWIRIFNKYGKEIWSGPLWNTDGLIDAIPPMGFAWMPLSWAIEKGEYYFQGRQKFTYRIAMSRPRVKNPSTCVVEVKQVIYEEPIEDPFQMLGVESKIKSWCEANPVTWGTCFKLEQIEPQEQ